MLWAQAWKPGSQHAGEKRGVAGLLLGRTERALGATGEGQADVPVQGAAVGQLLGLLPVTTSLLVEIGWQPTELQISENESSWHQGRRRGQQEGGL